MLRYPSTVNTDYLLLWCFEWAFAGGHRSLFCSNSSPRFKPQINTFFTISFIFWGGWYCLIFQIWNGCNCLAKSPEPRRHLNMHTCTKLCGSSCAWQEKMKLVELSPMRDLDLKVTLRCRLFHESANHLKSRKEEGKKTQLLSCVPDRPTKMELRKCGARFTRFAPLQYFTLTHFQLLIANIR